MLRAVVERWVGFNWLDYAIPGLEHLIQYRLDSETQQGWIGGAHLFGQNGKRPNASAMRRIRRYLASDAKGKRR